MLRNELEAKRDELNSTQNRLFEMKEETDARYEDICIDLGYTEECTRGER